MHVKSYRVVGKKYNFSGDKCFYHYKRIVLSIENISYDLLRLNMYFAKELTKIQLLISVWLFIIGFAKTFTAF